MDEPAGFRERRWACRRSHMHEPVAGAFVPWQALAAPGAHTLDPPIRPLVEALNRTTWARTVFSCAGHPEEPDSIKKGRRQAHVDLLVNNLPCWQRYVTSVRESASGVRVTEGSLGPPPTWLGPQLPSDPGLGGAAPDGGQTRLGGLGERSVPQRYEQYYRRLVIEPKPYDMASDLCRQTLDAALAKAVSALRECPP